jgi:hypothetical protein
MLIYELAFGMNNKSVENFLSFLESLGHLCGMSTTLVMVETSNYCVVVQILCTC